MGVAFATEKLLPLMGQSGSTAHRSAVSGPPISQASRLLS